MPVELSKTFVIGITSSALFDMTEPDRVFRNEGLEAYVDHQRKHADVPLPLGTGSPLVRAVLKLNEKAQLNPKAIRSVEVVVASRNNPATSSRLYASIKHHGLDGIERSFLSGGSPIAPYLSAFSVDLFLSTSLADVEAALAAGIPAALVYAAPAKLTDKLDQIRIAFDGDAVLFSAESEDVYQRDGMPAFIEHETKNADTPLAKGPFYKLIRILSFLQEDAQFRENSPIRIALVTARSMPTHERVLRTLESWGVRVDEVFFMGGVAKTQVLSAFRPHIFFDDQDAHCNPASTRVPTARVPRPLTGEQLKLIADDEDSVSEAGTE